MTSSTDDQSAERMERWLKRVRASEARQAETVSRLTERLAVLEREFVGFEERVKTWVEGLRSRVDVLIDLEKQLDRQFGQLDRQLGHLDDQGARDEGALKRIDKLLERQLGQVDRQLGQLESRATRDDGVLKRIDKHLEDQGARDEEALKRIDRRLKSQAAREDGILKRIDNHLEGQAAREDEALRRIEKLFAQMREQVGSKGIAGSVDALQGDLQAVIRRLYLEEDPDLPILYRLAALRFRIASQHEEDGITYALFRWIGVTNRRFVEIGCGTNGGNSGFPAQELGWTGMMIDAIEENIAIIRRRFNQSHVTPVAAWVTRDNVNELLQAHEFVGEIDLLSIDIDGNDYWVWEALEICSPRLVIVEYNSVFGGERAVVVPYDPGFDRHQHTPMYYGASLAALTQLAQRKGYRLIATEPQGVNAYFLRNDVEPDILPCHVAEAYRLRGRFVELVPQETEDLYQLIAENGLPLIDLQSPESRHLG